ncbi:MAG TPA: hypothetical protein VFO84_04640 [Dehalococcoidia bacterium]|nr:hypothetical protein [Dehalococcoidia bacterium]
MKLTQKWTLAGGLAIAALVAAFSLFAGPTQAGLDDPGELIVGDLECEKEAFSDGGAQRFGSSGDIIQGETVTYSVFCVVNLPGFDEGDPVLIGDIAINDQLPDNFDIEFATCEVVGRISIIEGTTPAAGFGDDDDAEIPIVFPAQVNGQNVTCVFPSPLPDGSLPVAVEMDIDGSFNEAPCGTIKNIAVAEMGGDEEVAEAVIFLECFDVSVTKTATTVTDTTGATVAAGGTIIYTIEVCNVAPAPALVNNVFFFDQLPLGTQFQSSASADFDLAFDATSSQVLGTHDQLQAGECGTAFTTVSVAEDAPCGTPLTNLVVAGSATGIISDFPFDPTNFVVDEDADPSNNQATVTTTVACPGEDEDGKNGDGPAVGTGDTGLLAGDSAVAGWQLGLLSLLVIGSLSGAYVAARRVR